MRAKRVLLCLSQRSRKTSLVFDKEMRKKSCELLTPALVEKTFGVPKDELKQQKIMGCIYSWKDDKETLEATLMMVMAHKSEERAKLWFANTTKSKTADEMAEDMKMVKAQLQEEGERDAGTQHQAQAENGCYACRCDSEKGHYL